MSTDDHTDDRAADELGDDDLESEELPEVIHVAEDLSEYLEKERYNQIFEAKNEAAETLREYGNPATLADNTAQLRLIRERVSASVISFITEIRRILEETEPGQELWANTQLATIELENAALIDGDVSNVTPTAGLSPVEHTSQQHQRRHTNDVPVAQGRTRCTIRNGQFAPAEEPRFTATETSYYYVLGGVADFLTFHDTEAEVTHSTDSPGLNRGTSTETVVVDPYPTVAQSRDVYQRLTRLLTDSGLDLELGEEEDDEWEI